MKILPGKKWKHGSNETLILVTIKLDRWYAIKTLHWRYAVLPSPHCFFSDEFVVNKASLLFEFMFISTTGRSSKLLHQAGGTTQRGLQEGEGEGQQETLRNGIRHFSEWVHDCHVWTQSNCSDHNTLSHHMAFNSLRGLCAVCSLCFLEFWKTSMLVSVRAVTVVGSLRVLSSVANYTHTTGLSAMLLIHRMFTGKDRVESSFFLSFLFFKILIWKYQLPQNDLLCQCCVETTVVNCSWLIWGFYERQMCCVKHFKWPTALGKGHFTFCIWRFKKIKNSIISVFIV